MLSTAAALLLLSALGLGRGRLATMVHTRVAGAEAGLALLITDHREAIDDFEELHLIIPRFALQLAGAPLGLDWLEYRSSISAFDLTQLQGGSIVSLGQPQVPSGHYHAVRLQVRQAQGRLHDGTVLTVPLQLSELPLGIEALPGTVTPVLIDLTVLDLSDHGQGYALVSPGVYRGQAEVEARLSPAGRPGSGAQAPPFSLLDQHGRRLSLEDLRGKIVVLTPIFTHCTQTCPLYTAKFLDLAELLRQEGLVEEVQLLMVTVDPERDRVPVVRRYAESHGVHWPILTGPPEEVLSVLEAYGIKRQIVPLTSGVPGTESGSAAPGAGGPPADPAPGGAGSEGPASYDVVHPAALVIIDRQGRLAYGFHGTDWWAEQVLTAILEIHTQDGSDG